MHLTESDPMQSVNKKCKMQVSTNEELVGATPPTRLEVAGAYEMDMQIRDWLIVLRIEHFYFSIPGNTKLALLQLL